jgi:hypothetical protein
MFFFNTEAHPIDGASLECCQAMREKDLGNKDEDWEMLESLNLKSLLNRYVQLRFNNEKSFGYSPLDDINNPVYKTMKQEYFEDKLEFKRQEDQAEAQLLLYYQNRTRYELNGGKNAFGCSLNKTFKPYTSLYNNPSYFP